MNGARRSSWSSSAIPTSTLLDFVAVRVDPRRTGGRGFVVNWRVSDRDERFALRLAHSTLTHVMGKQEASADASVATARATLVQLILRRTSVAQATQDGALTGEGETGCVAALFDMLDDFQLMFDIVTPGQANPPDPRFPRG